jgi:hypothetical protein
VILGARTYTVTRPTFGTPANGLPVLGTATTFTVQGSMQPVGAGDRLDLLPEWARTEAAWILRCDTRQPALALGDRVTRDSRSYLVHDLQDWSDHQALPYRGYVLGEVTSG